MLWTPASHSSNQPRVFAQKTDLWSSRKQYCSAGSRLVRGFTRYPRRSKGTCNESLVSAPSQSPLADASGLPQALLQSANHTSLSRGYSKRVVQQRSDSRNRGAVLALPRGRRLPSNTLRGGGLRHNVYNVDDQILQMGRCQFKLGACASPHAYTPKNAKINWQHSSSGPEWTRRASIALFQPPAFTSTTQPLRMNPSPTTEPCARYWTPEALQLLLLRAVSCLFRC
jgi:hypothetical protein